MAGRDAYGRDEEAFKIGEHLFKLLDVDGSGFLSLAELRRARTVMLCKSSNPELCQMAATLGSTTDTNSDGVVDKSEWHDFLGSLYGLAGRRDFLALGKGWEATANAQPKAKAKPKARSKAPTISTPSGGGGTKSVRGSLLQGSPAGANTASSPAASAGEKAPKCTQSAAIDIQKSFRARMARKQTAEMKAEMKAKAADSSVGRTSSKEPSAAGGSASAADRKFTTIPEMWDLLTLKEGKVRTSVPVDELASLFRQCKESGMDYELLEFVHMEHGCTDAADPLDLCHGGLSLLCVLLKQDPELTQQRAREEFARAKMAGELFVHEEEAIRLKEFRRLIPLVASLLHLDEHHLIAHMVYFISGVFELPLAMAITIRSTCGKESKAHKLYGAPPGKAEQLLLKEPFRADDFFKLLHDCEIMDETGKKGLRYADAQLFYSRVLKQLSTIQRERDARLRRKARAAVEDETPKAGFSGRAEFGVLIEELSRTEAMRARYTSPLHMCVQLIRRAVASDLVGSTAGKVRSAEKPADATQKRKGAGNWK